MARLAAALRPLRRQALRTFLTETATELGRRGQQPTSLHASPDEHNNLERH